MRTIQESSGITIKILGKPKASETGFRWMTYVLSRNAEDGVLLFHTLTRELLLLTRKEYSNPDNVPELREKWFRVPQEMDDRKYADQVRFVRKTMRKKPEHITNYTIFTTTDCNARCFYCYEMGRSRIPMTEETAHKAASYIAAHCGEKKRVHIQWFGGEPLFNKKVIDIICEDLTIQGVQYQSSIISNGYLFDEETVRQAVNLWNLTRVQIALDGTEAVFNHCKAFIYKDGPSPYQVVMDNIGRLLDAGIRVHVRMNMDNHNAEDLFSLAEELHQRFAGKDNLAAYSHVLFEFSGSKEHIREEEDRRSLYRKQQLLRQKLTGYGLWNTARLRRDFFTNYCMADSDKALTILPNGELGLCEHYTEDNFVGHIDREELDESVRQSFREEWSPIDACKICFFYPECIRLKKCKEQRECFPETQEKARQDILDGMETAYAEWLRKEDPGEEDLPSPC